MRFDPSRPGRHRRCGGGLVSAAVVVLLCISVQAHGSGDVGADLARRLLSEGKILPLEDIIRRARRLRDGSLIDAELSFEDDHATHIYELHMLDSSGDVWELEFDADTGELIEHEPMNH